MLICWSVCYLLLGQSGLGDFYIDYIYHYLLSVSSTVTWYNQEGREGGFKYHHVPMVFLNFEDNEKLGLHHLAWEIVLIYFYIMTIYSYIDVVNNIHIKKTWTIEKRKREKKKQRK